MTTEVQERTLAIIDPQTGFIIEVGPSLPVVSPAEAEQNYVAATETIAALKRYVDFLEGAIVAAWKDRGQREGLLGGQRYEIKQRVSSWKYDAQALFDALRPFTGSVFTEDELREAIGFDVIPAHLVPEQVVYAPATAKIDALARRSTEIAQIVNAHRSRDEGADVLSKKR